MLSKLYDEVDKAHDVSGEFAHWQNSCPVYDEEDDEDDNPVK